MRKTFYPLQRKARSEETKKKIRLTLMKKEGELTSFSLIHRCSKKARRIVKGLGYSLRQGEIVHHIDGNIRNNNIINLIVLKNHSEHFREHKSKEFDKKWKFICDILWPKNTLRKK